MLTGSRKVRQTMAVLTLAIGGFTSPVFAGPVFDCYNDVMETCDDALEASSWWQKPAVGLLCTGMLAGCGFEAI